jgi:hypothetical protein
MGRCYNIVFDSTVSYNSAATTNANRSYFINWDALMPDKAYKVSFSFMSEVAALTGTVIMGIQANLGGNDVYAAGSNGSSGASMYLGTAHSADLFSTAIVGTNAYMHAGLLDNPQLYLSQRPAQNLVSILLTNGLTLTPYATPAPADYALILHFEEAY